MRLRNGKVCEEGQDASTSDITSSEPHATVQENPPMRKAKVDTPVSASPGAAIGHAAKSGMGAVASNEDVHENGSSAWKGSSENSLNNIDQIGQSFFNKSAAVCLSEAKGFTESQIMDTSKTTLNLKVNNSPAPTKDNVVRPHSKTVLLALKVGAWSLVIMYFIVPAIVKLNPWIMSEIAFLHRIKVPFFVDLNKPERIGLNGTCNFEISSTDDIKLGAWHILPETLQDRDLKESQHYSALLNHGEPIVIYFHGNAGTRAASHRVSLYKVLSKAGYHVITVDYRGYGDSTGTPTEKGLVEDGLAVYDWVKRHSRKVPVYLWGHSLGSGVATQAGAEACKRGTPPKGVILDAPFTNIIDAASCHPLATPFRYMPYFTWVFVESLKYNNIFFSNDKHIKHITVPIMILHAKDDAVVPFIQGKRLHESASKGKGKKSAYFISFESEHKYGHDNIWRASDLPGIIRDFMAGKLNS